jgi:glycopeptide antibiotics resistance protein
MESNFNHNRVHEGGEKNNKEIALTILRFAFLGYVFVIIKLIIFKYPWVYFMEILKTWDKSLVVEGIQSANFTPFRTINMYIQYYSQLNSFENLFGNILIFIPYGILLPIVYGVSRNIIAFLFLTLIFILGLEVFQLVSSYGVFDVDDILLNCFGALTGFCFYYLGKILVKKKN